MEPVDEAEEADVGCSRSSECPFMVALNSRAAAEAAELLAEGGV